MRYVSIDIETTGIDKEICQIIEIGAIIEDTTKNTPIEELPQFKCVVNQRVIHGTPFAIRMNARLIDILADYNNSSPSKREELQKKYNILEEKDVALAFYTWLWENGYEIADSELQAFKPIRFNPAGKNYAGFDNIFLNDLPRWQQLLKPSHRVVDPGILFADWDTDDAVPGLGLCKKRAGLEGIVTHDALDDAIDIVNIIRYQAELQRICKDIPT